jgi:hypothetical protein
MTQIRARSRRENIIVSEKLPIGHYGYMKLVCMKGGIILGRKAPDSQQK